jgi:hypothetical protein
MTEQEPEPSSEHAVFIRFGRWSGDLNEIYEIEELLTSVVAEADVGEVDGHEVAVDGSDGTFYLYGPDADALLDAVLPHLQQMEIMRGATVILRYGPPVDGVREEGWRLAD